jgi:cytochrome b561
MTMISHSHTENHSKHTILMVLCCLIPILGIAILAASGAVGNWGYYGLILLCPLGHFIIMHLMNRDSENHQKQRGQER